ncbi:efflux transporter outer membrane subunit [Paraburkholderia sabiae]|uniref:Efflux transporter outer membrane subunit n=1 Tax=Paraburkholderia sabiae TaxID=273251 RepID=A0ABU9QMG8_9BURK|nr:efflux transporter outer membrane subunit [Paraburkholderia sabiae]WJZ77288.1 efflux transporter outer membrane subunit [Paraburkholderia sabiae]
MQSIVKRAGAKPETRDKQNGHLMVNRVKSIKRIKQIKRIERVKVVVATVGAAIGVMVLGGCAVGPDFVKPAAHVPGNWTAADNVQRTARPELTRWWERLNDPVLNALVNEAVSGNLDVATARAKVREARASYQQAGGSLYPVLRATGSALRSGSGSNALSSGASGSSSSSSAGGTTSSRTLSTQSPANIFQAGLDASWELDLFGANRRALESAGYGLDAAQWSLRATLLTLVGDVTSYYVQARGYQARIALARGTAASQEQTAKITRMKYEAGVSSALDPANAEGQAQTTLATIPALETSYLQAVHSLSVLTGRTPEALLEQMSRVEQIPTPALPIPVGVPADVLLARPDVRLAERQYAQYTAKVGQAEAARYPSVSLTGTVTTSGTQFGDLARRSSIGWSFGPSVTIPLFNGGRLKAAVEVAQAVRDQYFIAYQSAVLTALKDVENATVALSRETDRGQALQASVDAYRQALTIARALYGAGSTGFLEVLTAERSLYSAEDAMVMSRVAVTTDYIALNKALGGGWDGQIDTVTPEVIDSHTGPHVHRTAE